MKERIKNLRKVMKKEKLDGVLITSRPNTFYFSGFGGSASIVLITMTKAILATDFRYLEYANSVCKKPMSVEKSDRKPDDYIIKRIDELNLKNVGFEDMDVSQGRFEEWRRNAPCSFMGISKTLGEIRQIKDQSEIEILQKAVDIAEGAFEYILGILRPGMTEIQVAAELEYHMRKNGAKAPAFGTIVASGKRSSLPHGAASEKTIEKGDPVTMDFGALYNGYNSDMTRTVFVGKPNSKMKDIYETVLKAQIASEEMVHAGLTGVEIDKVARDIIYDAGYEGCFGHGLGHAVGIEVHEEPRLSSSNPYEIVNGNIVTVEPGIYVEDFGGVRIENMVLVNDEQPMVFNKSSKEMIIL